MRFTWAAAGGWAARWAAGAVLGQIIFGPTTMLFIALLVGVALGATGMYVIHHRARRPAPRRPVRRTRSARRRHAAAMRVRAHLTGLAARSWRALRAARATHPAPARPRFSPRAPRRVHSPSAPRY